MPITLMPLPYAASALEPAISAETLKVHHGKHHKAYVDKVNELVAGTALDGKSLAEIIEASRGKNQKLFNQAAQVWNHGFYWLSLNPQPGKPDEALAEAIKAAFSSQDALLDELVEQAAAHFGSGWAWLLAGAKGLEITTTHDADLPGHKDGVPLLVLDVWEHAYYLDRKNDRKAYLKAAAAKLDWGFASDNFSWGTAWVYPG